MIYAFDFKHMLDLCSHFFLHVVACGGREGILVILEAPNDRFV